jgi:small conductance mechanosensitive channel
MITLLAVRTESVSGWWGRHNDVVVAHAVRIAIIVAILIVANWLFRLVMRRVLQGALLRAAPEHAEDRIILRRRAETLSATLNWAFGIFLLFLGVGLVLAEINVDVSALIAGVGVVGIALGLGAQTLVKDVINGIFILLENQYAVGDLVTVGGATGEVVEINPRRTVLRDSAGNIHSVPNSQITVATNRTGTLNRIRLDLEVPFEHVDAAVHLAEKVADGVARERARDVLKAPMVASREVVEEGQVRLELVGDVRQGARWGIESELRRRMEREFSAAGLELRFSEERDGTG